MVVNNNPDMTNNYGSLEAFRSARPNRQTVEKVSVEQVPDKVEISKEPPAQAPQPEQSTEKPKKKRRGIIQGFKNIIAGIKKFGVATAEYTVATAKGLVYGTIAAAGVLGIDAGFGIANIIKDAKKVPINDGVEAIAENAPKFVKNASKIISKKGIFGAAAAGIATIGYQWFKASLNVSQRNAAIDHRWGSGHDEVIK